MMNWNNFEFLNPEFLWLLILVILLAIWYFFMRKKDTAILTLNPEHEPETRNLKP